MHAVSGAGTGAYGTPWSVAYLDEKQKQGDLSSLDVVRISEMTIAVIRQLASKNPAVQNGVDKIIGGQVMIFETDKAYTKGKAAGIAEGEAKGKAAGIAEGEAKGKAAGTAEGETIGKIKTYITLIKEGLLTREDASKRSGLTDVEFDSLAKELVATK